MREILFKGRRKDNREWVAGYYIHRSKYYGESDDKHFILINGEFDFDLYEAYEIDPETLCQYTNINAQGEEKIFTGDYLGDWCEDENGNDGLYVFGVVTYWESEGRYVLTDENGLCNDWTLEEEAQPQNWNRLIHCGNVYDK